MLVIEKGNIPIKCWVDSIENGAAEQAINISNLPFAYHHVALMPDTHSGYGMPIGGVAALDSYISPNMVGVDIGCGMIAVKTDCMYVSKEQLETIISMAKEVIPVGFGHQTESQYKYWANGFEKGKQLKNPIIQKEIEFAEYQLGTLGGGNHFLEIQKGSDGFIWLMIHSGSRNLGYKVANYYNEKAKELNEGNVPPGYELDCFKALSPMGIEYFNAMMFCLMFAEENRKQMMLKLLNIFKKVVPGTGIIDNIDIHHNYASYERHFGKTVIVHRKGAVYAGKGLYGIIPGSMGTSSYITLGLGNPESFESCSHGSGRVMSRAKAKKSIDLDEANTIMEGIVFDGFKGGKALDEAPQAYKNIEDVMENQKDLVKPIVKLKPLAVLKG